MLLFYRYQVLEDGCLIDNDNGRIMSPLSSNGKKPYHLVKDDNGKFHYFSVDYLMEKLGVETEEIEVVLDADYKSVEHRDFSDLSPKERVDAILGLL